MNWLLWKQPTSQEIIGLFDKKKMKLSIEQFQLDRKLEVCVCVCVCGCLIELVGLNDKEI